MRTLWAVNVPDPTSFMTTARKYGYDSVAIKSADGMNGWAQFKPCVEAAHKAGLRIFAWAYLRPLESPQAAIDASAGADRFIIDAEIEWQQPNLGTVAEDLVATIAPHFPAVDLTSFAFPSMHGSFPYTAFLKGCKAWWPQVYFADFKMTPAAALKQAVGEGNRFGKPIIPIGQLYSPALPQDIKTFARITQNGSAAFYGLGEVNIPLANLQASAGVSGIIRGMSGQQVVQLTTSLVAAGYEATPGQFDAKTEAGWKAFQAEHGMIVDGIVTAADLVKIQEAIARVQRSTLYTTATGSLDVMTRRLAEIKGHVISLSQLVQ